MAKLQSPATKLAPTLLFIVRRKRGDTCAKRGEREDSYNNFLACITFTSQQLDSSGIDFKSPTGVFVIKVSKVITSNPSIKIDEASNGDDSYTYSHLSDDKEQMLTIFTGSIIDCHLIKDAEKN